MLIETVTEVKCRCSQCEHPLDAHQYDERFPGIAMVKVESCPKCFEIERQRMAKIITERDAYKLALQDILQHMRIAGGSLSKQSTVAWIAANALKKCNEEGT